MKASERALRILRRYEQGPGGGPALEAYQCSAGVWTLGYGHTKGVKEGDTCTEDEADATLEQDVEYFEEGVKRLVKVPLTQNQFDALVCFAFNVGLDEDADAKAEGLGDSTLLRKLNEGDYSGAAAEFPKWNKAGGRVLQGLVARRAAERQLFESLT